MLAPLTAIGKAVRYRRERWVNDGDQDFVDVDWAGPEHAPRLLVAFHGLEGDSAAHYTRALAWHALQTGCWRVAAPHFRGCSGAPNRTARSYFSGDAREIEWILQRVQSRNDGDRVFAFGVSLGANSLLKWLCEQGDAAGRIVHRAAAVSAQFSLKDSGEALERGINRLYGWYFIIWKGMRAKSLDKLERFPEEFAARGITRASVSAASTFPEFDDALVSRIHEFENKDDYWRQCSTELRLPDMRVPTLLLNARNDPFYPGKLLEKVPETEWLESEFPESGGHASFPGRRQWMARRVLEFLSAA